MATNAQSVFDYFNVTMNLSTINRERLEEIRSAYNNLKNEHSSSNAVDIDELIQILSKRFSIANDTENLDRLKHCVTTEHSELVRQALLKEYLAKLKLKRINAIIEKSSLDVTKTTASEPTTTQTTVEIVPKIICQILVKQNHEAVIDFIENFLLSPLNNIKSERRLAKRATVLEPGKFYPKRVNHESILDKLIRLQLLARGGTIDAGRPLTKLPLIEPLVLVDEFDTWHFDYLRGLFEFNLLPLENPFPKIWKLDENAQIKVVLELFNNSNGTVQDDDQEARNVDRPSTVSLQRFVEDVCEKENNGMAKKWIDVLREDDIFNYDHLANLKYSEWSELKQLSMNGRKILKSYIDREKQMASDAKSNSQVGESSSNKSNQSLAELRAKIHQVKLYFHYTLADHFHGAAIPTPARLNAECVRLSFDELRNEGFEDDGLFEQMKLFFLPLTMVEEDVACGEEQMFALMNSHDTKRNELLTKKTWLTNKLAETIDQYYNHDDSFRKLQEEIRLQQQPSNNDEQTDCESFTTLQLLDIHKTEMERLNNESAELGAEIQDTDNLLNTLKRFLEDYRNKRINKCDKDLIKPNRGFIMYGPPGTGKSDIMSKLSVRMGICMVAPPLAAGELNRPLVGESERIIADICMRCHRIPYLMCCVSIDEIDSLAPKRKDDTGDGNLAKLSVLLSVIDGIKDVPNLMIFCATNRLHMMDDAFLRRMSGKFFVGRPSSRARKNILSGIKSYHMAPYLLDHLTTVTTNFSGAALRALRRLITVYCIDALRKDCHYQLDYRTMLDLTNTTARQYKIFFGGETLPSIIMRVTRSNIPEDNRGQFNDLTTQKHSVYTGKILVNLDAHVIDIEFIQIRPTRDEHTKDVHRRQLLDSEKNLLGLLQRLTTYGTLRNVQLIQLVDLNLLSAESAHDEKQKFETLKERLDECTAYRRSMIVYDLDSLVGINRSEGNASTGRTTNFSLINHNIYAYIKDKFQNTHVQSSTSNNDDNEATTEEKWSVVIISDPFLLRQFLDDVKFTRPKSELEAEKAEICQANEQLLCVQCKDYYVEQDNRTGACLHHDGFVYDTISADLAMYTQKQAMEKLLAEEIALDGQISLRALSQQQKEDSERQKHRFKYICCDQTVQLGGMTNGCKKSKHIQPHVTAEEWEFDCKRKEEYREKRLRLLQHKASVSLNEPLNTFHSFRRSEY